MAKKKAAANKSNGGGTATAVAEPKNEPDYKSGIAADLAHERRHHRECIRELSAAKQSVKDWKTEADASQIRINNLSDDLAALEDGTYQPKLFDRNGDAGAHHSNSNGRAPKADKPAASKGPQRVDTAAAQPISVLAEFGLTVKQCEKLAESELEITSIGKLEAAISTDPWWHRKVRGIGKENIDKVSDALMAFRAKHPVPSDDDKPEPDTKAANGSSYPDRNAPGGEDCGSVNRWEFAHEPTKSTVTVAVGLMPGQSFRSCCRWTIGTDTAGRDTPRQDSQPHASQVEAARAALDELIEAWTRAGDSRKKAAVHLRVWRDETFAVETQQTA